MKKIKLRKKGFAIVDPMYYDMVNKLSWFIDGRGYVVTDTNRRKDRKLIKLHRSIMNARKNEAVDHINRDRLDNRIKNLRICTIGQNNCNRGKQKNNTSGYKGVTWDKKNKKWQASIQWLGKAHKVGRYKTAKQASLAYNKMAKIIHGEFAYSRKLDKCIK